MARATPWRWLNLRELGAAPHVASFSWPCPQDNERLRASLLQFGQLHPLLAIPGADGYSLVAGRRRAVLLEELGAEAAAVRVVDGAEPRGLWDMLLEEHCLGRPPNPVEVGLYIVARMAFTGEAPSEIAGSVLPRLGLPSRAGVLDDFVWVAGLPDELRGVFAQGRLPVQGVRVLRGASKEDVLAVLSFLASAGVGANRFSELARWTLECAWEQGTPVATWIREEGLDGFEGTPEALREQLRRRRHPAVAARVAAFERDVRSLRLPDGIQLTHSPWFEGGRLFCRITFGSLDELEGGIGGLTQAIGEGRLRVLSRYLG